MFVGKKMYAKFSIHSQLFYKNVLEYCPCPPFSLLSGFGKKSAIGAQPKDISEAFDRPDMDDKADKSGNY